MIIPNERARFEWISSSVSDKLVTVVNEMIESLRILEPVAPQLE